MVIALVSDSTYALLAGSLGQRLGQNTAFLKRQKYVTGSIYVALGLGAAAVGKE
ncbi:hypothetical protein [Deinococcus xinjiangensis]|uniref:hypothetical protein n=1 Tax=Deinococcus xinjiangensis TaxID=457454 RepID=UPI0033657722